MQDETEVLPPNTETIGAVTLAGASSINPHGIEIAVEFKPVEHPTEPLHNDRPILCPLPEPSILNVSLLLFCIMKLCLICLYAVVFPIKHVCLNAVIVLDVYASTIMAFRN